MKSKQDYHDFFFAKIREYNKTKSMFTHYINLKDGNLMIIRFVKYSWKFDIVQLEEEL